jgi:hypothetical protein
MSFSSGGSRYGGFGSESLGASRFRDEDEPSFSSSSSRNKYDDPYESKKREEPKIEKKKPAEIPNLLDMSDDIIPSSSAKDDDWGDFTSSASPTQASKPKNNGGLDDFGDFFCSCSCCLIYKWI